MVTVFVSVMCSGVFYFIYNYVYFIFLCTILIYLPIIYLSAVLPDGGQESYSNNFKGYNLVIVQQLYPNNDSALETLPKTRDKKLCFICQVYFISLD